jgi:hypothetical protein
MKYLKKFESLFGTAEPEKIDREEFHSHHKSVDFSVIELEYLESLFDENHTKIQDVEYYIGPRFIYNKFKKDKHEFPNMFYLFMYPIGENEEIILLECYKCEDDWFFVTISQDNYHEREGLIPGFREYWRCDEFDSLKKLLDKWL